jgi:Zn-dependent protease
MSSQPAFRLFGFPVHVRPGFYMFMLLVVFLNGEEFGLWLAGFIAAFTLLHELGHAFAARATGARAEISLDFLAGYASFAPTRELKRWERAGISVAGPAIQIVVSVIALLMIGVKNPLFLHSGESVAAQALWFAGPLIGFFNLVPILPLDGGNILLAGLEAVFGKKARDIMLFGSLIVTIAGGLAALSLLSDSRFGRMAVYGAIFPLMAQLQMLRSRSEAKQSNNGLAAAAIAETAAWRDGDLSRMVPHQIPSPWYRAYQQLHQTSPELARAVLLDSFSYTGQPLWLPPDAADEQTLRTLVALLPSPLPTGNPYAEQALAGILVRLGEYSTAAHYAADSYQRSPSAIAAFAVARSAAALGDRQTAIGWLHAAENLASPAWINQSLQQAPTLAQLARESATAGEIGSR